MKGRHSSEGFVLIFSLVLALCAGLLHDYAKAYSNDELLEKASELGLDYGCDLKLVLPILHGPIAARELRGRYPELDEAVFSAIERHTVATCDMSPLDMVIFIADGIDNFDTSVEPLRQQLPGFTDLRVGIRSAPVDVGNRAEVTFFGTASRVIGRGMPVSVTGAERVSVGVDRSKVFDYAYFVNN